MLSLNAIGLNIEGVPLLNNVSLDIEAGEVLAIIGPNGAGKSSLLKVITGEINFTGKVLLAGTELEQIAPQVRARQLAVLPQRSQLAFDFTAEEVVALGRMPHTTGAAVDSAIVKEAIAQLDISYLAKRPYTRLSGGEQQRVQLARVLVQIWRQQDAPHRVLLLDEPTSALDIAHQHQLMTFVKQVAAQGVTVVVVLHDFNLAARYANRIAALRCGELVACGAPKQVLTPALFHEVFGVRAHLMQHPSKHYPVMVIDD